MSSTIRGNALFLLGYGKVKARFVKIFPIKPKVK